MRDIVKKWARTSTQKEQQGRIESTPDQESTCSPPTRVREGQSAASSNHGSGSWSPALLGIGFHRPTIVRESLSASSVSLRYHGPYGTQGTMTGLKSDRKTPIAAFRTKPEWMTTSMMRVHVLVVRVVDALRWYILVVRWAPPRISNVEYLRPLGVLTVCMENPSGRIIIHPLRHRIVYQLISQLIHILPCRAKGRVYRDQPGFGMSRQTTTSASCLRAGLSSETLRRPTKFCLRASRDLIPRES
jgi:hypothetical protein